MKKITVKIKNIKEYIQMMNGFFELTDSEINVLSEFIKMKMALDKSDVSINPFSVNIKKKVAEALGRDDFNTLNSYIKRVKDKGAIYPTQEGYKINRLLIPDNDEIKITLTYE